MDMSVWFLLGAVLVFFMQCGFAMVETGFTRAKNAGNIIMKNMMDFCIGTIVFILIIAILVQLLENILKKFVPALYKALGVYLPLITTNCTILGVTVLNIDNGYEFIESIVCAAGAGLGFLVAMVLFSGVRRKVEQAITPACFKGLPITLVAAAVTSLSFMGFGGIIESIFGA